MQKRLAQWKHGQGFAAIRADWLERAAGLGEILRVRLPERELSGRFRGLDEGGRLLLEQGGIVSAVTAGEVFRLRRALTWQHHKNWYLRRSAVWARSA